MTARLKRHLPDSCFVLRQDEQVSKQSAAHTSSPLVALATPLCAPSECDTVNDRNPADSASPARSQLHREPFSSSHSDATLSHFSFCAIAKSHLHLLMSSVKKDVCATSHSIADEGETEEERCKRQTNKRADVWYVIAIRRKVLKF